MYTTILFLHSFWRWLVLLSLVYAIYRGASGWLGNKLFTGTDNTARHVTATIAHVQLALGYILYFISPLVIYFRSYFSESSNQPELRFFGIIHIAFMTLAIILITIGSSLAKRADADISKFRIMTIFFFIALLLIVAAIPWPFSPFANRPYFRPF